MFLQASSLHTHLVALSSNSSCSRNLQFKSPHLTLIKASRPQKLRFSSSISQNHSTGTVGTRPVVKWKSIFKKVSKLGPATALNTLEKDWRKLNKLELFRIVKEFKKLKSFKQALEVCEWMNDRRETFRLSTKDVTIHLDLTFKVRGISSAEDFFLRLPDDLKDGMVYRNLLNAYLQIKSKDKAESLFETMRGKGYATNSDSFNMMMTLYMNLEEYDRVDSMVEEMKQRGISLDKSSYNIWLQSCGSQGSAEKMEQVYDEMKENGSIDPSWHWSFHCTMATAYIKMGLSEKAEESLRKVESAVGDGDRPRYHFLITLYGNAGNKEGIYRSWNAYKSVFSSIPYAAYRVMIMSLITVGDITGAEKIYEERLSVKSAHDTRLADLLLGEFVKEGEVSKAMTLFHQMLEGGEKPSHRSWEYIAEGHVKEKRRSEALSCLENAFAIKPFGGRRIKPRLITGFFDLCEEEGDSDSREVLVGLLRQSGALKSEAYASLIGLPSEVVTDDELLINEERSDPWAVDDDSD